MDQYPIMLCTEETQNKEVGLQSKYKIRDNRQIDRQECKDTIDHTAQYDHTASADHTTSAHLQPKY